MTTDSFYVNKTVVNRIEKELKQSHDSGIKLLLTDRKKAESQS